MNATALKRKSSLQLERQIRRARTVLRELSEMLEDIDDRRALAKAKKQNGAKPLIPWSDAARELGISRRR